MTNETCRFRDATEEDFAEICQLIRSRDELFLVYPNGVYPLTVSQVEALADIRKELTVVVDGERIIGFANLYDFEPGQFAFIGNVVIDANHRSMGIGKRAIAHMLDMVFNKYSLPEARISVFSDNTPALLLYSGLGFIPYAMEERKTPQGGRTALIHMRKFALK